MKYLIGIMLIGLLASCGDTTGDDNISPETYHNLEKVLRKKGTNQVIGKYDGSPADGKFASYHSNGKIKHLMEFNQGIGTGQDIQYYANGNQKSITHLVNGWPNGSMVFFYENGNIKSKSNFDDQGRINGDAQWYHNNGSIMGVGRYLNNRLVECKGKCN